MKKYGKFAALITVVVGTVVWLAVTGGKQSQAYYKTVNEVRDVYKRQDRYQTGDGRIPSTRGSKAAGLVARTHAGVLVATLTGIGPL